MKRLVIYHANCPDGFTAAWAAWKKFGDEDTEYVPASYGKPPPDVSGKDVLIVDFSYPRDVLLAMAPIDPTFTTTVERLLEAGVDPKLARATADRTLPRAISLRVLDHHKTAKADLEGLSFCEFDMNRSGAGMTWDALYTEPRPWLVNYVEDRDLWRWKLTHSKEINAAIGSVPRTNFSSFENETLGVSKELMVVRGEAILAAQDQYVAEVCKNARMVTFEGFTIPCVNCSYVHMSEIVGALAEKAEAGFAIGWLQKADGRFGFSLRARKAGVDVSALAKLYGGGGHPGAAGFERDSLADLFGAPQ